MDRNFLFIYHKFINSVHIRVPLKVLHSHPPTYISLPQRHKIRPFVFGDYQIIGKGMTCFIASLVIPTAQIVSFGHLMDCSCFRVPMTVPSESGTYRTGNAYSYLNHCIPNWCTGYHVPLTVNTSPPLEKTLVSMYGTPSLEIRSWDP